MGLIRRIEEYIRKHGAGYTLHRAVEMLSERLLHTWERKARRSDPCKAALEAQRAAPPAAGLISVVIPVYNTRPQFLKELVKSLQEQTYPHWEAVLFDGGSTDRETMCEMDALSSVPGIRVFHDAVNRGISGNTNQAIRHSEGEYIALCDHDDVLAPDALWQVACVIADESPDMIYSDEDKLTENGRLRTDPHLKPDFCPDNLRSGNYICHLTVIRRDVLTAVGGLRCDFDGSQDHDLVLRIAEQTARIRHIPHVLYHWRTVGSSMSHQRLSQCQNAAARAVAEHMQRLGWPGSCAVEDGVLRLRYDIASGMTVRTLTIPAGLSMQARYQWMNRAAAVAEEKALLFVDGSVSEMNDCFVRELLMYAQRDDIAAVTPLLMDRRMRVAHAGFALKNGRICGRNAGLPAQAGGWHGMNRTSHNVMAVSAACFMVRRDHFIPFDEAWTDGLGMVDWCLKLRKRGLRCAYTPHAQAVCEERRLLSRWTEEKRLLAAWPGLRDECSATAE